MITAGNNSTPKRARVALGTLAAGLFLLAWAGFSVAAVDHRDSELVWEQSPQAVFEAIASAWTADSAEAMAHLVQVDGIRVSLGSRSDRAAEYSPSQAVYYFKGLFDAHDTVDFRFTRMQDVSRGERAHGMAIWRYGLSGASGDQEMRLVFLLTRQDDVWRLSEINQISVR